MRLSRRAADPRWRRREQRETRWPLPVQCVVPSVQWRCPCPGQVLEGVGDCDIQSSPEAKAAHADGKFALVPRAGGRGVPRIPVSVRASCVRRVNIIFGRDKQERRRQYFV